MRTILARSLTIAALGLAAAPVLATPAALPIPQASRHPDALNTTLARRVAAVASQVQAARAAGRVSQAEAARLNGKIAWVRTDSARHVREQGFLSAGESASYNRSLDEVERKLR
ncbi:hypothetical protein [Croceibacterium mercuriale]|uniref:hypothetical protein n=1 Tax=Croceibacterium mercuriale TaxID=1572751 RepID=UPI000A41EDA9|nr:hypothetical protein [Croceibacterium mercuriale]